MIKHYKINVFYFLFFTGALLFALSVSSSAANKLLPPPPTLGPFADICDSYTPIKLSSGTPAGGLYSGKGVIGGYFYPYMAGPGTHVITYTVYVNGVLSSTTATIKVNPKPGYKSVVDWKIGFDGSGGGFFGGYSCPSGAFAYSIPGCAGSKQTYSFKNDSAGSTYAWSISNYYGAIYGTGGTLLSGATTDSVLIDWNGTNFTPFYDGSQGYYTLFKVVETNKYGCKDSSYYYFQITKPPVTNFNATTECLGSSTGFTDASVDASSWSWDFGDGTKSTDKNPLHTYNSPGTYQVKLVTTSGCYCKDSITKTVTVLATPAHDITCPSTLCPGTPTTYSTPANCGSYNWVVNGGTIKSGQGTKDIQVDWGPNGPTGTVSLQTTNCSPAMCSLPTVKDVALISSGASIAGKTTVCEYETGEYSMPAFPGSNITWSIVPAAAGNITGGQGSSNISVQWLTSGTAQLVANIEHAIIACKGSASLTVKVLPYLYLQANSTNICLNSSTTITANGSGNVTWNVPGGKGTVTSGQGTGTAVINWTRAGFHQVIAKPKGPGFYCNDSSTTYVYVDSVAPPTVDGPIYICPGSNYRYNIPGNYYQVGFTWGVTGGTITSQSNTDIYVTWNATGPYSIQISRQNQYQPFCSSIVKSIPVYDLSQNKPPITGKDSACVNGLYSYSVPFNTGASYSWSVNPSGAGSIVYGQGTNAISIEFTSPGTAVLTCNTYFCTNPAVSTFTVVINPSPNPTINSAGFICPANGSVTLSSDPGYTKYNWTLGGVTVDSVQNATITKEGYYVLYATAKNGCVGKNKIKVPLQDAPFAHISSDDPYFYGCAGAGPVNTVLNELQTTTGGTRQWYRNGVPVGTNTPTYTATDSGKYWLVVTNSFGCVSTSNPFYISKVICGPGGGGGFPGPPGNGAAGAGAAGGAGGAGGAGTGDLAVESGNGTNTGKKTGTGMSLFGNDTPIDVNPLATQIICTRNIQFSDVSPDATDKWYWNFGDLTPWDSVQNPLHLYSYPGYYEITFFGRFAPPKSGWDRKTLQIEIPYMAKFKYETVCGGANFYDQSFRTLTSPITGWLWDFGDGNTSTLQNPSHVYATPGTYTVRLTISGANCSRFTVQTVVVPPPPQPDFSAPPVCVSYPTSFTDATIGTDLYDWNWDFGDGYISNNRNTVHTFGSPGTYNVKLTVTDVTGCSRSITKPVVVSSPTNGAAISANGPTSFCQGGNVQLTVNNTASTYQWSNGGNSQSILVDQVGYYRCTVTYATGCSEVTAWIYINVLRTPQNYMYSSAKNFICSGTTANFSTGFSNDYSYQWYNSGGAISGANAYNYTTTSTGTYWVEVRDNTSGCTVSTTPSTISTIVSAPVLSSISGNLSFCEGQSTSLSVSTSGGTAPFKYNWTGGGTGTSTTVKKGGSYYVSVSDKNGCYASTNTTVTMNLNPNLNGFPVGCYDMCLRDTIRIAGGMGTYQWFLDGAAIPAPEGTQSIMIVKADGAYNVIATSVAGCKDTSASVNVTTKPLPIVSAGPDATICALGGEVDTLSGSTDGVSYSWSPPTGLSSTTILNPIASPSADAQYILSATGANTCRNKDTVQILVSCTNPKVTVLGKPTCPSACITLSAKGGGGIQPYTYSWSGGLVGNGPHSVCPTATTIYTITITDSQGFSNTDTAIVRVNPSVTIQATATDVSCIGKADGRIAAFITGGTKPYSYLWSNAATNDTIINLAANLYTLTVTDSLGCIKDTVFGINEPDPIIAITTPVAAICGQPNGSVSVSASGGTGVYAYSWSATGSTAQTYSGIAAGSYTVTVNDANNCSTSATATVANDPGNLTATANLVSAITCNGANNGAATVVANGGNGVYTYTWLPSGGNGTAASTLVTGTYTVGVSDGLGCTTSSTVTLIQPAALVAQVPAPSSICIGQSISINASANGGTPNYTYSWMPGSLTGATITVSPTTTTTYTLSTRDANGCSATTVTILADVKPALQINAGIDQGVCAGASVTLTALASGGDGNYTYTWQPLNTTVNPVTITPANATTYTVSVSDGCGTPVATDAVAIAVNSLPIPQFTADTVRGCQPLCVNFTNLTPGTSSVCAWDLGDGKTLNNCNARYCYPDEGVFTVGLKVTDTNGCTGSISKTAYITVFEKPVADFIADPEKTTILTPTINFTDKSVGSISSWNWSFGEIAGANSIVQNPEYTYDDSGKYTVQLIVNTPNGCTDTAYKDIIISGDYTFYIPNAFTPNGDGVNEVFLPRGIMINASCYEFRIFDRWGDNIFSTTDPNKGWDGRANNGNEMAQQDVYIYKIQACDYKKSRKTYVGHVTLVR